ncbi:MAG: single-stranded DNA-binding protein [Desulfobacteraceae bacterium]|nr:single-stranded DNA-binding protein [Desulfobacteraceae bacterium]
MASLNKLCLIGFLGRDPEIRYTQSGQAVANFSVATTDTWTDKVTGEKRENTTWFRISAWGRLGEICGQYLSRGKQVYIEGRVQLNEWTDKDGNNRANLEVLANQMVMLGRKDEYGDSSRPSSSYDAPRQQHSYDEPRQAPAYDAPRQAPAYEAPRPSPAPQPSDMSGPQHMEPPGLGPEEDDIPF